MPHRYVLQITRCVRGPSRQIPQDRWEIKKKRYLLTFTLKMIPFPSPLPNMHPPWFLLSVCVPSACVLTHSCCMDIPASSGGPHSPQTTGPLRPQHQRPALQSGQPSCRLVPSPWSDLLLPGQANTPGAGWLCGQLHPGAPHQPDTPPAPHP